MGGNAPQLELAGGFLFVSQKPGIYARVPGPSSKLSGASSSLVGAALLAPACQLLFASSSKGGFGIIQSTLDPPSPQLLNGKVHFTLPVGRVKDVISVNLDATSAFNVLCL